MLQYITSNLLQYVRPTCQLNLFIYFSYPFSSTRFIFPHRYLHPCDVGHLLCCYPKSALPPPPPPSRTSSSAFVAADISATHSRHPGARLGSKPRSQAAPARNSCAVRSPPPRAWCESSRGTRYRSATTAAASHGSGEAGGGGHGSSSMLDALVAMEAERGEREDSDSWDGS